MATYQNNVKHADTTAKSPVSIDDIKFLQTLQTIMNTQDDMGNADPRFWVIKGQKTVPTGDDYADGFQIIDNDGNAVADSTQSAIRFMKQQIDDFGADANLVMTCDETDPAKFTLVFTDKVSYTQSYTLNSDDDMDEFVTIMNSYLAMCPDIENQTYRRVPVKTTEFIYPDTLFITHEAAESHLKANAHHYDPTAHAYAMTAWRSPQIEQLWSLLRHADFDRLIKLVQEVT